MRRRELARLLSKDFDALTRLLDEWRSVLNPFLRTTQTPTFTLAVPIPALASVADGDVVLRLVPGFYGRLVGLQFYATTAVTTASRMATLTARLADLPVTGGSLVLMSADLTPKGALVQAPKITGNNTFTNEQELTVVADVPAAFAEGAGVLVLSFG